MKTLGRFCGLVLTTLLFFGGHTACVTSMPMGSGGIREGMDYNTVLAKVSRRDRIISKTPNTIVSEGQYDPVPAYNATRKTFLFRDGRLINVSYRLFKKP